MSTYAVIETGGKQYRVQPGDVIDVERLTDSEPGDTVRLDKVLLLSRDGEVIVGTPVVAEAQVVAKVEAEGKGEKIIVFKYKSKVRYRKKTGHRQWYSRLTIQGIEGGPATAEPRRPKKKVAGDGA